MTFEGGFLFRPFCVGGVRVPLAVKAQKRGRYFSVKTVQSQANVMLASLVKTRFMQGSILSELRDEQVTRHAMDSGEVPSTVLTGFWKFRETLFCEPTCFCFRIENVSLILAWRRMVYSIYVSTCFNTAWISGKKLWRKLFLTNTFRPVTHQLRYTWWLAV